MDRDIPDGLRPFVRKIDSLYRLAPEEEQALASLPMQIRELRAAQAIVREGDKPSRCCLVLEGFAQRYKVLEDGRRQIFAFHIPGDVPDLLTLHLPVMDHDLGTLSASKVAFISHDSIRQLLRAYPRIGDAFWRDTLVDASVFREWMLGLGRRQAVVRVAHLICELIVRMRVNGIISGSVAQIPLTQTTLADALGLSTVHANRCVQELRRRDLITWDAKVVTIKDWEALQRFGEFDPTYLHLHAEAEV